MVQLLTIAEVIATTHLSKATVYRRIADGSFPAPVRVGARMIRFRDDEVGAWIERLSELRGRHG